jgi:hypothetical protein
MLALIPMLTLVIISDLNQRDSRRAAGYSEARTFNESLATGLNSFGRDIDSYMTAAALVIGSDPSGINAVQTSTPISPRSSSPTLPARSLPPAAVPIASVSI